MWRPDKAEFQRKVICSKSTPIIVIISTILILCSGQNTQNNVPIGAVVTDHEACSDVGTNILAKNGSAVDAAIAALLCNGVRTPHSMGIGGGCFMVIYDRRNKKAVAIDGREVASLAATADVFSKLSQDKWGGKIIGVPWELMAYKKAHQMYGNLPWKSLFVPAINMAEEGYPLGNATAEALALGATYFKVDEDSHFWRDISGFGFYDVQQNKGLSGYKVSYWRL